MKTFKFLLLITLLISITALIGCTNQTITTAQLQAIDYSLYGPQGIDLANQ